MVYDPQLRSPRIEKHSMVSMTDGAGSVDKGAAPESSVMLGLGQHWYAVHTRPLSEMRAQGNLRNENFPTFLPKRRKTVRHARRITTVEAPLFPRYLFVGLDLKRDQWRSVNGTFGVARLVMQGDRPQPVPEGVVETLIASSDEQGIMRFGRQLKPGMPVRLMSGPFAERLAILDRLDGFGRVQVLLDLMGRQIATSVDCDDILPVG